MNLINQYKPDKYTKLLLHFDGDLYDSSRSGHSVNPIGGSLDAGTKKFGSHALSLNGTSDYISAPDSDDWTLGANDFTIEGWFRFTSSANKMLVTQGTSTNTNRWYINYSGAGHLQMEVWQSSGRMFYAYAAFTPTMDVWYHLAIVRSGTTYIWFVNGIPLSTTLSLIGGHDVTDFAGILAIGGATDGTYTFSGHIDELRISKGIARWTADFSADLLVAYTDDTLYQPYKTNRDLIAKYPLHWWKLDSDVIEDIGSIGGTPTVYDISKRIRTGPYQGDSYYFKGADTSYIDVTYIGSIPQGSIALWVKIAEYGVVFGGGTNGGTNYFDFRSQYTAATAYGWVGLNSALSFYASRTPIYDDQWHHVIIVVDGIDNRIFIDGVRQALMWDVGSATTANAFITSTTHNVTGIGRRFYSGSAYPLKGGIKEVQIYSDYLTDADAESIYKYGVVVKDSSIAKAYPELFTKNKIRTYNENRWEGAHLSQAQQSLEDEYTRLITAEDF